MSAVPQIPPEPRSSAAASQDRRIQMLRTAMGPVIAAALEDPDVVEVMLNPDRTLWVDRLSSGRAPLGVELPEADGERIIRLVAAHVGAEVHRGQPLLTAELPETGERFEGILPPAAPGPAFALRKRAVSIIGLDRYVADGILTTGQAEFLRHAVRERHNILIAGGTSTGKTTLANALLAEIAATGDRVLVLEDTIELQCAARDHVPLRTRAGVVSMTELVRATMRLRPDRVIVGEVRGGEALDLVKVWGTGHPGGIATPLQRHLPNEEMVALGWMNEDGELSEQAAKMFKSVTQGASTTLWAATAPALKDRGGEYCEDCDIAALADPENPSRYNSVQPYAVDEDSAERLWAMSEEMVDGV